LLAVDALVLGLYVFARLDRPVAARFGPVGEAVHAWLNRYEGTTVPLSATARRFKKEVRALGGIPNVLVNKRGFLGIFGRAEEFSVGVRQPTFDDEALGRLADSYGDRIEGLYLDNAGVTDAGLRHLKRMTRLRQLRIRHLPFRVRRGAPARPITFTDAGMVHLKGLTRLESLNLIGLPITDAGLEAISDLPALTDLGLFRTSVQGTSLARLKSLPRLSSIGLDQSAITEDGLRALAGATSLETLSLRGVPLTKEALPRLRAIPRLQVLQITGSGLLEEEVLDLVESRPEVKVVRQ
jgi:hypothetical protein